VGERGADRDHRDPDPGRLLNAGALTATTLTAEADEGADAKA
jgi:hypothetical protein